MPSLLNVSILIIFVIHSLECSSFKWRNHTGELSNSSLNHNETLKCKTDASCIDSHSICLNGTCRRICNTNQLDKECLYFHCDGKLSNFESNQIVFNKSANILIETNNYPLLKRYLSNKKCSWILKNLNQNQSDEAPFIQLKFERFSTELSNDYLYIFAGDSIFSPLIAALSGTQMASNEPSLTADYDYDSTKTVINFLNITSIYLLFKSDVASQISQTLRSTNHPNGISIKYKFSSQCHNSSQNDDDIYCTNLNRSNLNQRDLSKKQYVIETVQYIDDDYLKSLQNSTLRRAFHCSFMYRNYYYTIGGYSYANTVSLISRLNLNDLKWEHNMDRMHKNTNRSNRRFFSDFNFEPISNDSSDYPANRYAHSCVLDENNNQFYMFGGFKYETNTKQITNELWKYNLITNKWSLLNSDASSNEQNWNQDQKLYILPISVVGHSMSLIKKNNKTSILIFFGFSEYYGSTLNIIQEYILSSKTWKLHNTLAFNVNIGFAHTLIHDSFNNLIYLYGGLNINSPISNNFTASTLFDSILKLKTPTHISSKLYSYDYRKLEWKQLQSSSLASYLHSSILYQNYLITYGGIQFDSNDLIISNQLRLYNIDQNEWLENMTTNETSFRFKHRQRYSHTTFIQNDSLFIFAGFNGFFLNDLFKFDLKLLPNRRKRQLIYPTNGDDPILLQQPLFQDLDSKPNFIDVSRSSKKQSILSSIENCNMYLSCHTCQSDMNCIWNSKNCEYYSASTYNDSTTNRILYKKPSCGNICNEFKTCFNCTNSPNDCVWCATQSKCLLTKAIQVYYPFGECINYINEKTECPNSVTIPHMYPYSNFVSNTCSSQYSNCSSCVRDEKCGWCSKDSFNLDLTGNTGIGLCIEGGETNSSDNKCKLNWYFSQCPSCECNGHSVCSKQENKTELNKVLVDYYSNNLIYKHLLTNQCDKCLNNTDGDNCSQCKKGFYGNSKNNGTCSACDCGKQSNNCDSNNGRCFCSTKGVIGSKCDQCETPRYTGRPNLPEGTCYYNLSTDYQFTFNLNKDSDRYYTRINFVNHPTHGSDDDIDFMVRCYKENALINVSFVASTNNEYYDYEYDSFEDSEYMSTSNPLNINDSEWPLNEFIIGNLSNMSRFSRKDKVAHSLNGLNNYFGPHSNQIPILIQINCTSSEFKYTFSNRELNYAEKNRNSTFIVHVYDFQTPITIQIAFSRRSRIQLLHFFITFFGCLFSLLAIAFISWKSKQRYDRYRRQRQIIIQMEQMASRPFTRILVDVTKKQEMESANFVVKQENKIENKSFRTKKFLSRRNSIKKQDDNTSSFDSGAKESDACVLSQSKTALIMPVAVEPLSNNKAAILTCLLKLPQGGLNLTPKGSSPLVLASAYVQLNSYSPLVRSQSNSTPDSIIFDEEQDNSDMKTEDV